MEAFMPCSTHYTKPELTTYYADSVISRTAACLGFIRKLKSVLIQGIDYVRKRRLSERMRLKRVLCKTPPPLSPPMICVRGALHLQCGPHVVHDGHAPRSEHGSDPGRGVRGAVIAVCVEKLAWQEPHRHPAASALVD
eukprot:scaffold499879_cov16-Prasinocladus_malaysianus.AAC.1